jgi:hypothetical protein
MISKSNNPNAVGGVLLVTVLLAIGPPAAAQSPPIPAYVIAGGGATSGADGVYTMTGTIGQAAAGGELVGGTFVLVGGFWAFLEVGRFTDDPLIAGLTVIRAVHIAELRARIDAVRAHFLLGSYPYTDSIMANATTIRARQMAEARTALDEAYDAAMRTRPSYSTSPEVGVTIRVADIAELRAAIQAIE